MVGEAETKRWQANRHCSKACLPKPKVQHSKKCRSGFGTQDARKTESRQSQAIGNRTRNAMALRADELIDRSRLRRKLTFWRAATLVVAALAIM